jgi:hypothetical protein
MSSRVLRPPNDATRLLGVSRLTYTMSRQWSSLSCDILMVYTASSPSSQPRPVRCLYDLIVTVLIIYVKQLRPRARRWVYACKWTYIARVVMLDSVSLLLSAHAARSLINKVRCKWRCEEGCSASSLVPLRARECICQKPPGLSNQLQLMSSRMPDQAERA